MSPIGTVDKMVYANDGQTQRIIQYAVAMVVDPEHSADMDRENAKVSDQFATQGSFAVSSS
jgi:hypothetical protein